MPFKEIVNRNECLCALLTFKQYKPKPEVEKFYQNLAGEVLSWWYIPNLGRYNGYELKFHCDYNWLISAVIEFKKYDGLHKKGSELERLFNQIKNYNILDINKTDLWLHLTTYAQLVIKTKALER